MNAKFLLMSPLLAVLTACGDATPSSLPGYVEGDYVRVASSVGGRLVQLPVQLGQQVQAGQPLFVLEQDSEAIAVQEASARVAQAASQADDLATGKRPQELAAIAAALDAAEAVARQSHADWQRQQTLAQSGFVSNQALASLAARRDADAARVRELAAQLASAKLSGRVAQRKAADAARQASEAALQQAQWRQGQKQLQSSVNGLVTDRYYRVGEWVPAGSPVLSLLPPTAIKVRFFVPQTRLAAAKPGNAITLTCDGCGQPIKATVRYLSNKAEYTPPMLYTKENRAKLLYLAEAQTSAEDAARLRPGQPVDVLLAGG